MIVENRSGSPALALAVAGAVLCVGWMMIVRDPVRIAPRARTAETGVPVAPALDEIAWGEHAWESHGTDADRAVENLKACGPDSHAYWCGAGTDTYYVYVCQFPENPGMCAGAIVGKVGVCFTTYVSRCSWWFKKTEGCQSTRLAGR